MTVPRPHVPSLAPAPWRTRPAARRGRGALAMVALFAALGAALGAGTPAVAQLSVPYGNCARAETEDAALYYCRAFSSSGSGTEEQRITAAVRASQILRARGDLEGALEILWHRQSSPELDVEMGHVYFEMGEIVLADYHYENAQLAGLDPDPELRARMVEASWLYGEELLNDPPYPQSAITAYERALSLDPDHGPSHEGLRRARAALDRAP